MILAERKKRIVSKIYESFTTQVEERLGNLSLSIKKILTPKMEFEKYIPECNPDSIISTGRYGIKFSINIDYPFERMEASCKRRKTLLDFQYVDRPAVKQAALRCLKALGPYGGLLLGDGANVCPDTPLENLAALTETAEEYGHPQNHHRIISV